jgi:putative mRNA 3-end processing factor
MSTKLPLEVKSEGLYCKEGDFFIDAWKSVPISIITHAHGDHAYWGHKHYIVSSDSQEIIRHRLGNISLQALVYGEKIKIKNCWVSLHPAGHILGSSQVRIETKHSVTVISGDYKRALDKTCEPFEVIECDLFVTESTFGLPIYHWQENQIIARQIFDWWEENKANKHPSVLFCYSLGKAQRILSLLAPFTDQTVYLHGAIQPLAEIYAQKKIPMIPFEPVSSKEKGHSFHNDLILAPPSAAGSLWLKRFPHFRTGAASGWMQVRGTRKRKNMDSGFVLSDHADWDDLIKTVQETKASKILTTHGSTFVLAKYLKENFAIDARELKGLETIDDEDD